MEGWLESEVLHLAGSMLRGTTSRLFKIPRLNMRTAYGLVSRLLDCGVIVVGLYTLLWTVALLLLDIRLIGFDTGRLIVILVDLRLE